MVEPRGFWFKGFQQPSRRSISGGFNSTMETVWKRLDQMYDRCIITFNRKLQLEPRCHGAFDNHNKKILKKTITDGKTAINHIGTSTFLKEDRPYQLPIGTTMQSSLGIDFMVTLCAEHSSNRILIRGVIITPILPVSVEDENANLVSGNLVHEQCCILSGFPWPEIGWEVIKIPGFTNRPSLEYRMDREIQPPLMAWVEGTATNADILFNAHWYFVPFNAIDATSL